MLELIYETHSISEDNEHGIASGWLPGKLSARGRELAVELGRRHRDDNLAAVFVSDLQRAVETAHIAFAGSGLPLRQDVRLRECDYGELNGSPVAVLAEQRRAPHPRSLCLPSSVGSTLTSLSQEVRAIGR